jgi:hypothetical protein
MLCGVHDFLQGQQLSKTYDPNDKYLTEFDTSVSARTECRGGVVITFVSHPGNNAVKYFPDNGYPACFEILLSSSMQIL